jgi:dipeptidyl aminopeptidase/acylaminoacyl peptidase
MPKFQTLFLLAILTTLPCRSVDVIFGRRIYAASGRTYQQIWTLDSRTKKIAPLTTSERRHGQPVCSPDSKRIWFVSGPFGNVDDSELWWFDRHSRTETMATKLNVRPVALLGGTEKSAFFTALEGDKPGLYRWDGRLSKVSPLADTLDTVALSPDARTLAVQAGKTPSVTMFEASGAQGRKLDHCANPKWSADGRKLACMVGSRIRILDAVSGVEAAHAEFTPRPTPPYLEDFSPDGKRLLVGTVGANHTSTTPQLDYWTLDIATGKWDFIGPGQAAIFAGGGVILGTPRDLATVGKVHEWVAQILLVDPATHAQTPVAGGTAYNVEPCRCLQAAP